MKNINFISSPSTHNQHSMRRWFLSSLVALSVTVVAIFFKQAGQLWRLLEAQSTCSFAEQQCCTSNECLNSHRAYAEQSRTITHKLNQLSTVQNSLKRVAECMRDISHGTHDSRLERCDIKENKARFALQIPHKENIQPFTDTLSNTKWAHHVLLESINTTDSDGTLITINISLKA